MKTPTTLIIMDGFGLLNTKEGNAIQAANTPNLDRIFAENPSSRLSASGLDVGLPEGQMGNSEVGHTNIGAGRVVFQDLPRISLSIQDGSFFQNEAYVSAMDACKEKGTALHLMGLLSDGGVHSHISHLFGFLQMAKDRGLTKVYIHCFLDGRDVPPTSGRDFVAQCAAKCKELGVGQIATVMGRYYAMDRDNRWERVEKAYAAMVYGDAPFEEDPVAAVELSYQREVTDEFMEPVVCLEDALLLPKEAAARLHPVERKETARRMLAQMAGSQRDITALHVEQLLSLLDKKAGKYRELPYGLTAERTEKGVLLMRREAWKKRQRQSARLF